MTYVILLSLSILERETLEENHVATIDSRRAILVLVVSL